MRFIGDVHANRKAYSEIIKDCDESIQVGDYGIGFGMEDIYFGDGHRFIRGNHDDPGLAPTQKNYIHDGTIEDDVMFVGGALSIDRGRRVEGVDWWRDEELSYSELLRISDMYIKNKPKIMVTHECPEYISNILCKQHNFIKFDDKSRTRNAFQHMFEEHKPELWIFGHWHLSFDKNILGTRFICLNINEYIDYEIN